MYRSQWPRGLRRRSAAARLLRSWFRIPPRAWMLVCCECCVLSGRGLCDELITGPEEFYRLWCVVVCDLENLKNEEAMTRVGSQHHSKKKTCLCSRIPMQSYPNINAGGALCIPFCELTSYAVQKKHSNLEFAPQGNVFWPQICDIRDKLVQIRLPFVSICLRNSYRIYDKTDFKTFDNKDFRFTVSATYFQGIKLESKFLLW